MAIIDSISIGSGRGKLGKIILQRYGGKTIARSKNNSISVPATENQLSQRVKFDNVRIAWNLWKVHYNLLQGLLYKPRTSISLFFKVFLNVMPSIHLVAENDYFIAVSGKLLGLGNLCDIIVARFEGIGMEIEINPKIQQTDKPLFVNLMLRRYSTNTTHIQKIPLTFEEYISGFIFVPIPVGFWNSFSVYLSSSDGSLTSNIAT